MVESDIQRGGKTLFTLYPEYDLRLVYKKYKKTKAFEMEDRIYATYFVNLSKLLKNAETAKIQYENQISSIEELKPIDTNTLCFNSTFESGNLFSAFKV